VVLTVVLMVMSIEGQGADEKETKIMMLIAAITFTVGAFPEQWLVWL